MLLAAADACPGGRSSSTTLLQPPADLPSINCKYCGKVFAGRNRQQRLQSHSLIHTGEKPHPCPYCPYRARLKYNLKKHVFTMHHLRGDNAAVLLPPNSDMSVALSNALRPATSAGDPANFNPAQLASSSSQDADSLIHVWNK